VHSSFLQFGKSVLAEVFVRFVACFAGAADFAYRLADADPAVPTPLLPRAAVREYRKHYADLHVAYMDILNEELAPFALLLALSLAEFEDQLQQRLI